MLTRNVSASIDVNISLKNTVVIFVWLSNWFMFVRIIDVIMTITLWQIENKYIPHNDFVVGVGLSVMYE